MAIFKKKSRRHRTDEVSLLKKLALASLVLGLAAVVLGGAWLLSKMGPQDVDFRELATEDELPEEVVALVGQAEALEAEFDEILAMREARIEDVELLREARDLFESYTVRSGMLDSAASLRLNELDQRYQDFAANILQRKSLELEAAAEELASEKNYEAARSKYREAYQLQDQINQQFPRSKAYNVGRATSLDRQGNYLVAEPLLESSLRLEEEAEVLIDKRDWVQAEEKLAQAIAIQDQLNRNFRGTNQASIARLERLRTQLVGIRSGQTQVEIEVVAAEADAKKAAGKNLEAARLYTEAARLQRQLNENFKESPFASAEMVADFQRKAETAMSFNLGRAIERNYSRLKQLLDNRETFEAAEVIVDLRQDIKQMKEAYPRSSLNDVELEAKIRYLNLVQSDLGFIQNRVYDALVPIPGEADWRILRTEVPQALFSLIMGMNPSRNRGDVNPVDSVSWTEAKQFCRRLSWIMGKPVRLPTENEFRAALGPLRYVVLEDHVWSLSDASNTTQPIGKKASFDSGCYDLLGNVSEWLESVDRFETEDARHIGGHALDSLETIFTVPLREAPREERNRMTGFRIVMQLSAP